MREPVLFTDLLIVLHVPHTYEYSVRRFTTMPFLSLFGLSKLLQEYGVDSAGYMLDDPSQITSIKPPFLLQTRRGFLPISSFLTQIGIAGLSLKALIFCVAFQVVGVSIRSSASLCFCGICIARCL